MTPSQSSGLLSVGTTELITRPCLIHGATLTQASAAGSLTIYDNASAASGTEVLLLTSTVNSSTVASPTLPYPLACNNGATVVIAGTGATGIVYYSLL